MLDQAENGGNHNGFIDPGDQGYSQLLLWVDANHDGFSQANELRSLAAAGVHRIDLNYSESQLKDKFGNLFFYKAGIWDQDDNPAGRYAWDVFLTKE